jgi:hypothetical protein
VGLLRGGDRAGDGGGDPVAVAGGQQVEQGAAEQGEELGAAGRAAEQGEELGAAGRSVVAGAFGVALVLPGGLEEQQLLALPGGGMRTVLHASGTTNSSRPAGAPRVLELEGG